MSQLRVNSIVPAGGIPAGASGGGIIQVVSTTKTDTFSTTSTSYVDITGMSATVTPSNTNNKILVIVDIKGWTQNSQIGAIQLLRNGSAVYIGNAAGSRAQVSIAGLYGSGSPTNELGVGMLCYLDSPATTSAVTYKLRTKTISNSVHINRQSADNDNNDNPRAASSITLMEISG